MNQRTVMINVWLNDGFMLFSIDQLVILLFKEGNKFKSKKQTTIKISYFKRIRETTDINVFEL